VLGGNGRGLRVRVGPSSLMRIVSTVEVDVERAFLARLDPGDVVYDIGANIGWFSLLAARRVGPEGAVVAFEPSLANADYVRRNAVTNGFGNLTTVAAAVSSSDGWARFADTSSLEGHLSDDGGQIVPVLSLDAWHQHAGVRPPGLIKIDIEGAEENALRGMEALLREHRPTLIVELHGTGPQVMALLDEFGYDHMPLAEENGVVTHVLAR
jgi:FkbM family methyltransferase